MFTWAKEKLKNAGRWVKKKVRWILVATGIVGIASAPTYLFLQINGTYND